ncbi:MAG: ATPase [Eubacteriales bacterium]|nr:ATPase [Eubacteriales bacterium]
MANTNTDILLEDLEDVLDDATSIPLSKKYAVDIDKIKTIIEDIRLNTPQEIKQAKAIVNSRNTILEEAKNEAADIIKKAQEDARELVARDEITKTAQAQAAEIISKANEQGKQMVTESQNQASEILSNATAQANEMVTSAQNKSREILAAVNNYADDTLLSIDDALYKALTDVRRIRQGISNVQKKDQ